MFQPGRNGRPITNSLIVSRCDGSLGAKPKRAHQKDADGNRLEYRALHVLGPAAQARPYRNQNAGKAGDAGENTVQKSDARIGRGACSGNGFSAGTKKRIQAVKEPEKFRRRRARCADRPMSAV